MKSRIIILFLFVFLIFNSEEVYASLKIDFINNVDMSSQSVELYEFDGKHYVNVLKLVDILKMRYIWHPFSKTLELTDDIELMKLSVDSELGLINNKVFESENNVVLKNGGLYIPLNLLAEFRKTIKKIDNSNIVYSSIPEKNKSSISDAILKFTKINMPSIENSYLIKKIRRIIIDPGHGGHDPGAVSGNKKIFEKDITLYVALELKKKLNEIMPDAEILLTRIDDRYLSLRERSTFANSAKGDLFISIHCNSGFNKASGFEIYYFSLSENDETDRTLRLFENSVEEKFEDESSKVPDAVSFIKTDMAQINHVNQSIELGNALQNKMAYYLGAQNRGVRNARFYVLKDVFMPAVLIELGFISNKREASLMKTKTYQDKLAFSIANAVKNYKEQVETVKYELNNK